MTLFEQSTLHVAACYSNPFRWRTRRQLASDFRKHITAAHNVELHFVELAYGERPFDVTGDHPGDIQLRTQHELFHKENLLNIGVRSFPKDWKYGAVIDADLTFTRQDWALEAIHQLQMYDFVQLFSSYSDLSGVDLGHGHRLIQTNNSFAANYHDLGHVVPKHYANGGWKAGADDYAPGQMTKTTVRRVGATGGAWAFRRSAFDTVGGLLERCILGHGDWFMAFGLLGELAPDMHVGGYSPDYLQYIRGWQERAAVLKKNVGFVDGHILHHFHGPKTLRGYGNRDTLLVKHSFSPHYDVHPDWQGVLQLTPDKPRLRDDIRRYFLSRSEDLPHPVTS